MIIDCISDLHGFYPKLEGGDLLIIAGDLTGRDTFEEHVEFKKWLYAQDYRKKIVVAGNHDNHFVGLSSDSYIFSSYNTQTGEQILYADYLMDSGCEFEGLKIWGSPWTKTFEEMNPKCKAFTIDTEEKLAIKFSLIPNDVDILVTHSPPYGTLDEIYYEEFSSDENHTPVFSKNVGSVSLSEQMGYLNNLKLHVFGHIHESYGKINLPEYLPNYFDVCKHYSINASLVNEHYQPMNKPIRVIL